MYALRKRKPLKISVELSTSTNAKRLKIHSDDSQTVSSSDKNQKDFKYPENVKIDPLPVHSIVEDANKFSVKFESDEKPEELVSKYFLSTDEKPKNIAKKTFIPKNWELQYNNIKEMRSQHDAVVDSMGAHSCVTAKSSGKERRFEILVALLLSSQTRDQITHAAMSKLFAHKLTVPNILITPEKVINELIYPVGFYPKKAASLKKIAIILHEKYADDIPATYKELTALPGIGPKMAHLTLTLAWGDCQGISVDTHVHRISNRLKWIPKPTNYPEKTRKALEDWLPQSYWSEINLLLVGFGQQICRPLKPLCSSCLNRKICPSSTDKK